MDTKQCKRCKEIKPIDDFYRVDDYADGHIKLCSVCTRADQKKWRDAHPGVSRKNWLMYSYNMTLEEYDKYLLMQGNKCAICGVAGQKLVVDHDHSTDEIRGLLCQKCNKGIAFLQDSPRIMLAAIRYIFESLLFQSKDENEHN